jgi:phosphate transport system substrate-binding protein
VRSYPCVTTIQLSDGVANYVHTHESAITYVETSYAIERERPVGAIRNAAGMFVLPNAAGVGAGLTGLASNPDGSYDFAGAYGNPSHDAYPLPSVNYFIVPTTGPPEITSTIARVLGHHVCNGQEKGSRLGYTPLTSAMLVDVLNRFADLPGSGAPPNPTLDDCPNL